MFSRAPLAKQAPVPRASVPARSAQTRQAQTYFAQNETELLSPQFAYSLAGIRTFAEGEPHEGSEDHFANRRLPFPIQARLTVGAVNDPLETEADRVADQVMRMPTPRKASQSFDQKTGTAQKTSAGSSLQRKCECGGTCDDCKTKDKHDEHAQVQMKAAGPGAVSGFAAPPIVHEVLRSSGQPLDAGTRSFMEPRFGRDFSQVRVHTNEKAVQSAGNMNALAYAVGPDIVFGENQYAPRSDRGRNLLAHELAHVVQQGGTRRGTVDPQGQSHHRPVLRSVSQPIVQRQSAGLAVRLNDALSRSDWESAARALNEMPESEARAELSALNSEARARIRAAALNIDPSPTNRLANLIDSVESASGREAHAPAPAAAPQDVSSLSAADKLGRAWGYARATMAEEAQRALRDLFSPASLAIMAGFVVAYIAAQLTPVGWVADAIALASLSVAAVFMGRLLFDIIQDIYTFFSAVNATTEAELREAGRALSRAVARGGVQILVLILTRGMRGGRGRGSAPPPRTPPPSGALELVTNEGVVVRVPPEAVPEVPAARFSGGQGLQRGPLPPEIPRTAPGRPAPAPEVSPPTTGDAPAPPTAAARPGTGRPAPATAPRTQPQLGEGRLPQTLPQPVPVPPRRGGERGTMRHQIQRGNDHHASLSVTAVNDRGVTARQLRDTMAANFRQYMDIAQRRIPLPRGWVRGPVDWEGPIRSAIIAQSQAIGPIVAAGGISIGGDVNALRRCFDPSTGAPSNCATNDVRLDVENRGHNLRS